MDLTLTKEYIDRVGSPVYLSKWAIGSSYLNYNNASTHFWEPLNNSLTHANAFRAYGQSMRNWWKAMAVHQAAGRVPDIKALIWFQGEQDATVEAYANSYSANGVIFFQNLQAELGYGQNLKKFICRIHINGSETYESTVRTEQATLAAALTNATLIDTDGFSAPDVHLDYTGQLDLGTYLAGLI
jgi:hypothetical protein